MKIHVHHPLWKVAASGLLAALLLQGCGGSGSDSASTTSNSSNSSNNASSNASSNTNNNTSAPATQLASGVVTGFGSVFVDGTKIEDANASVVTENADGSLRNTVLQMGQHVRVKHDGKGTASQILLDAAVIGTVGNLGSNTLTVAGQQVNINTDAATGPLTVWGGGYSSMADVVANDLVEVHGSPVYDSTRKTYTVTASRIQKITTATGRMQVAGSISNLDTSAQTFALNGLTVNYSSAALRPANTTLGNGTVVTVYAPLTAASSGASPSVNASNIKVNRLQDSSLAVSAAQIGGQVTQYDSTANTFEVQGIQVTMTASTTTSPTSKTVRNGAYVNVRGNVGSDGSFTATNIQIRTQDTSSDLASVKLLGVVSDFVDRSSFVVRGVPVDASQATLGSSCAKTTLANDVGVQIIATQQVDTPVVLASSIQCAKVPGIVIRPLSGSVSNLDSSAKTFALNRRNGNTTQTTVRWTDTTAFVGVTADTLDAKQVRVEGYLSGTTLVARSVRVIGSGQTMDDDAFQKPSDGTNGTNTTNTTNGTTNGGHQPGWTRYRKKH